MNGTRTPPSPQSRPATPATARLVRLGPGLRPLVASPARPSPSLPPPRRVSPAQPVQAAKPVASRPPRPRRWVSRHKILTAFLALGLLGASVGIAALLIRQDLTTSPSTTAPDVKFLTGTDYTAINTAGFATVTLGTSGASATLALSGVSGAALVTLGNVMKLQNTDATVPYDVTLARSASLNAAITSFVVTIKDGGTTLLTWDAVSAATSSSFNLAVSKTLDITVALVVTDGTAAGALGSFGMQFSLTPA